MSGQEARSTQAQIGERGGFLSLDCEIRNSFSFTYNIRMDTTGSLLDLAYRLVTRLERLSVDSSWARRASGMRGGLIKAIEEAEQGREGAEVHLDLLVKRGYQIVEAAAREIPDRK